MKWLLTIGTVYSNYDFLEWVVRILAWGVQIGAVLLLAAFLTVVAWSVEEAIRKRRGKFLPRFLIALLLVCAILAGFALNPPVICPERYEDNLTPELRERVRSGSSGLYSLNIPMVPVCIEITEIRNFIIEDKMEYSVKYIVYYFCLASVERGYSTYDGYF